MHFEKVFSEILRCFKILKVSGNVVTRDKFLTLLSVPVVLKDNYLIHFENGSYSCNLTDEICSECTCLRYF